MDKNSLLYQLMAMRMSGILNDVAEQDGDYQASLSAADPYIDQLKALHLPNETRQLIDDCVSRHIAIGSCFGRLAYLQGLAAFLIFFHGIEGCCMQSISAFWLPLYLHFHNLL